ncbi:MAG: hypothetical protein M3P18_12455 [Actinomycetota bacterium]|nr:hypothetical protein [Actinomycetota bacterium]
MKESALRKSLSAILAAYVYDQSAWRSAKAREFPDDPRNPRAAEGLRRFGMFIEGLNESDPRVQRLIKLSNEPVGPGAEVYTPVPGQRVEKAIAQFCFRRPETDYEGFLTALAGMAKTDAESFVRRHDDEENGMTSVVVSVDDPERGKVRKKFQGLAIIKDFATSDPQFRSDSRFTVYRTRGGRYAVYWRNEDGEDGVLDVYEDIDAMESEQPEDLVAALRGETPIEVLDI